MFALEPLSERVRVVAPELPRVLLPERLPLFAVERPFCWLLFALEPLSERVRVVAPELPRVLLPERLPLFAVERLFCWLLPALEPLLERLLVFALELLPDRLPLFAVERLFGWALPAEPLLERLLVLALELLPERLLLFAVERLLCWRLLLALEPLFERLLVFALELLPERLLDCRDAPDEPDFAGCVARCRLELFELLCAAGFFGEEDLVFFSLLSVFDVRPLVPPRDCACTVDVWIKSPSTKSSAGIIFWVFRNMIVILFSSYCSWVSLSFSRACLPSLYTTTCQVHQTSQIVYNGRVFDLFSLQLA